MRYRRPLTQSVSQTNAAILVADSYATLCRSMRRTAAVVTRIRRDLSKREVDHHISINVYLASHY